MSGRTVEEILAEWRETEDQRDAHPSDGELQERVSRLRLEHATAIKDREADARELGRPPGG